MKTNSDKKTSKTHSAPKANFNRRREWRLDLPLAVRIEGLLPSGDKFSETTKLQNISSHGAYFFLDAAVTIGTDLNLYIVLPSNLAEGKSLKLCLGGETVRLEKLKNQDKQQGVAIDFHEEFKDEEFQFITED